MEDDQAEDNKKDGSKISRNGPGQDRWTDCAKD